MEKRIEVIGQRPNEVAPHQQFVDGSGQFVRVVRGESAPVPVGRAYGFIECYASKQALEASLRKVISSVRTPQGPQRLEVTLTRGFNPDSFRSDSKLHRIATDARDIEKLHYNYTIEARSEMSNYETGLELGTAIAQSAMLNPNWYTKDGKTESRVVYKKGGKYFDIE